MKLKIEIRMDNAAFEDNEGAECARILRSLAEKIEDSPKLDAGLWSTLYDCNGKGVGKAVVR